MRLSSFQDTDPNDYCHHRLILDIIDDVTEREKI